MKKIFLALVLFSISVAASAQRNAKEDLTFKDEKRKIAAGVQNGTITKAEAKHLKKEAKDVQKAKRRACSDGQVTKKERARIARQDRQLDKKIRTSKSN